MDDLTNKGTGTNSSNTDTMLVNQLELEENKRLEINLFFKNIIKGVKESVNQILGTEELKKSEELLADEIEEIKKNANEYSIVLSLEDDIKIKELNKEISLLIDEGEELYGKILEKNNQIKECTEMQNQFKLTYVEDRRRLRKKMESVSIKIDEKYGQKMTLFKRGKELAK
ncbi:MAG: hypothetical protein QM490_02155 [Candidatus Gracilibacteria bacterium]